MTAVFCCRSSALISSRHVAMYLASSSLLLRMPRTRSERFLSKSRSPICFTLRSAMTAAAPPQSRFPLPLKSSVPGMPYSDPVRMTTRH